MQGTDIILRKSISITDTGTNGGVIGYSVIQNAKHALFPVISPSDRDGGTIRLRKCGVCNINADDESIYDGYVFFSCPSNGQDAVSFHLGAQSDVQSELTGYEKRYGCGTLASALGGGETSVSLVMESDEVGFAAGGYLVLHNHLMTGQTVDDGTVPGLPKVLAGDSCEFSAGAWRRRAYTTNFTHPYGRYLGGGVVYTRQVASTQQLIRLAEYKTVDEVLLTVPTGNSTTQLVLANLTPGNGIEGSNEFAVVVTAISGGTERTVTVGGDGSCSGYCSAGTLTLASGVWTTQINWTSAPDGDTDITATYYTKNYTQVGNAYTIELDEQVANPYSVGSTYGAGVLYMAEITTGFDNVVVNSTSGVFDFGTFPPVLYNIGTPEDTVYLTFSSPTAYSLTTIRYGTLGNGATTADFSVMNPDTGTTLITIPTGAFGGSFQAGDTVTMKIHPAILPLWMVQDIPDGMAVLGDGDHWSLQVMCNG